MHFYHLILLWSSFALVFVLGKELIPYFHILDFIALRFLIAGPILLFYKGYRKCRGAYLSSDYHNEHNAKQEGLVYGMFLCVAIFQFFLPFVLEYWAQRYLTAAKMSLIYAFTPFITAILSLFLHKDKLSPKKCIGLLLGMFGASFVFMPQISSLHISKIHFAIGLSEIAVFGAIFSSCFAWILTAKLINYGFSSSLINGVAMIIGGLVTLVFRISLSSFTLSPLLHLPMIQWLWFFLIIGLSNFVGYPLYTKLLSSYTPTFISLSGFICPILTAIFGYVLLGEQVPICNSLLSLFFGALGLYVYSGGQLTYKK